MCGAPIQDDAMLRQWTHSDTGSVWCEGKASVAIPENEEYLL